MRTLRHRRRCLRPAGPCLSLRRCVFLPSHRTLSSHTGVLLVYLFLGGDASGGFSLFLHAQCVLRMRAWRRECVHACAISDLGQCSPRPGGGSKVVPAFASGKLVCVTPACDFLDCWSHTWGFNRPQFATATCALLTRCMCNPVVGCVCFAGVFRFRKDV